MTKPKFLQFHYISPFAAVNLNRGDDNQPKRMYLGDYLRTRISSQSLKRHWADLCGINSIYSIPGVMDDYRSREFISGRVMPEVAAAGDFSPEVLKEVEDALNKALYGKNATEEKNRQALLLSLAEVNHLVRIATEACQEHPDNAGDAGDAANRRFVAERNNFMVMRENTEVRHGLRASLFGRMVTSFPGANVDAPIHVAHAYTVHQEECEVDHFSTVDDLLPDGPGQAAYLGETQVNSGIFYGYVVVDVPLLVQNLEAVHRSHWQDADRRMTGEVLEKLIMTIATVSPGAKKGSTAPYTESSFFLVEAGEHQPRTLGEAFREPVRSAQIGDTIQVMAQHIEKSDRTYGQNVVRRHFALDPHGIPGSQQMESAMALAEWVKQAVQEESL